MSDEFSKAPRAKVEAEEPRQHQDEQREASQAPGAQQDVASAGCFSGTHRSGNSDFYV